jgi:hypothetical protein
MQVPVGFDYVLILEWLKEGDQPTGAQLHEFLQCVGYPSELVVCNSWEDVEQALQAATAAVGTKGIPVVHVETHGSNPWLGEPENIGFGPWVDSAPAWSKLGALLAPLNVAAGFRLLVVSAACWGSGVMAAIEAGDHPAPFACALGLRTEVSEGKLRDAMREFYRCLRRGDPLSDSVESAQRQLEAEQELRLEIGVLLAAKIIRNAYRRPSSNPNIGPAERRARLRAIWDRWYPRALQEHWPVYKFQDAWVC